MQMTSCLKPSLCATVLACLALAASPPTARAATSTTTFTVSTNVQTTCVISATKLSFGPYSGTSESDSTSIITVQCSNSTPYNVGLDAGTATGATVTTRKMTGPGSALLNYALYSDTAKTKNWGNTVGTDTVTGTGNGLAQSLTVYGRVPAGQGAASGIYTDTITATITY